MANGVPVSKGQVHDAFTEMILRLQAEGLRIGEALELTQQRIWQNDDEVEPFNIPDMGDPYDRSAINSNYVECVNDANEPGTVGDVVSVKTQGDILATMERGYRARHATSVRCLAHAAARRKGHGHGQGIFSEASGPLKYVTAALKAGQESSGYGGPASPGP